MRRKILTLVIGAIGGQILAFAALPIISRLYTPEQLGSFQIMLAFCNTLGIVTALSLERTLLLEIGPMRTATLRRLAGRTALVMALLSVPLYLLFVQIVPAAPLMVGGVPVIVFVWATVLFRGLFLIDYTAAIAAEEVRRASLAIFVKDVARIAARIGLGLSALNPIALFIAGALDWTTGVAMLWRRRHSGGCSRRRAFRALLWRYREYPFFYAPAAALTTLTSQMPVLLLGSAYPVREAGLYSLAFLLLDRPSRIVAKASGDILTHRMARAEAQTGRRNVVRKAVLLSMLNLGALLLIAAITWSMGSWILGREWAATGRLAFACVPHAMALFISDLSIGLFAAVSRTASGLVRQLGSLCVLCAGFGLGYAMGLPVIGTVLTAGLAHLLIQTSFLLHFARQFRNAAGEGQP